MSLGAVRIGEREAAIVPTHRPLAFVDQPVVIGAEPRAVVEAAATACRPVNDVVRLDDRATAPRKGALATLLEPCGPLDGLVERAADAADVEHLAGAAEDDRQDAGVAAQPAGGLDGDLPSGAQRRQGAHAISCLEVFPPDRDDDARLLTVDGGHVGMRKEERRDLAERVVPALPR